MNILIVDDDTLKIDKIRRVLDNFQGSQVTLEIVTSAADAIKILGEKVFDLMLLDLNLPIRDGENPRKDGGVRVLKEINRNQKLKRPVFVIGLTGHQELKTENGRFFELEGWTLIEIAQNNNEWEEAVLNKVNYIHGAKPIPNVSVGEKKIVRSIWKSMPAALIWTILCSLVTAAFLLGLYFGQAKFDAEKNNLYEENKELKRLLNVEKAKRNRTD